MFPLHHPHLPRVMSASPKPPIIPPQPQFQSTDSLFLPRETPLPPPRNYQLVQIRNESTLPQPTFDEFTSFSKIVRDPIKLGRRNYENTNAICDDISQIVGIGDVIQKIENDERRKPYYYNELHTMAASDLTQLASYAEEIETNASTALHENNNGISDTVALDDELGRSSIFNVSCGSGDSLDNVV